MQAVASSARASVVWTQIARPTPTMMAATRLTLPTIQEGEGSMIEALGLWPLHPVRLDRERILAFCCEIGALHGLWRGCGRLWLRRVVLGHRIGLRRRRRGR